MSTRMCLFEVVCLFAVTILLWAEFSRPIGMIVHKILPLDYTALLGKLIAQNIDALNHIRPPPLLQENMISF